MKGGLFEHLCPSLDFRRVVEVSENCFDHFDQIENKPGPAQVGAISKAQKQQKDFQVSIYSTRKSKNQKKWTEWRAGAR